MTTQDTIAKARNLECVPIKCKYCQATDVSLVESYINFNPGDSLIVPHLHLNLVYACGPCSVGSEATFVVRARIAPDQLYFGDFDGGDSRDHGGTVCDESRETQAIKRTSLF